MNASSTYRADELARQLTTAAAIGDPTLLLSTARTIAADIAVGILDVGRDVPDELDHLSSLLATLAVGAGLEVGTHALLSSEPVEQYLARRYALVAAREFTDGGI